MAAFEIALAANTPYPLPGGNMFMLRETVYPVTVRFTGPLQQELTNDSAVDVEAGFKIKPSRTSLVDAHGNRPRAFNSCTVESATAQTIKLYIADGDVDDDRTTGTVEVVDGGRRISLANRAFVAFKSLSGSVSNYNHYQLWNPAGSGYRVMLKNTYINHFTGSGDIFILSFQNTALGTLETAGRSKAGGILDTDIQLRTVQQGTRLNLSSIYDEVNATPYEKRRFEEPVFLDEGEGFMVGNNTVNVNDGVSFEYVKEAL